MLKTKLSEGRKIRIWGSIFFIFCALYISPLIFARTPKMNLKKSNLLPHPIFRTSSKITVDGNLNEDCWQNAWSMELKYEINPGENLPAPVKSEVLLTYDRTNFYIAFRCFDPDPSEIRAKLSDRDKGWNDDRVVVVLDTFNDERRAFNFCINPLGVQMDYAGPNGQEDVSWDAIWASAGNLTDWGWVAEMSIPFSSLSFQRTQGSQTWGLVATRYYPRDYNYWLSIVPSDRNNNCVLCQALKINGFEGITPGRNIEITPSLTGLHTESNGDMSDRSFEISRRELEPGVTAKWGISPNIVLNGTINPDFSQIEADSLQLDINEPFALYYQERRPFFTEGNDFFATPLNIVYTRTMRDPIWGLKLAGKEGKNTLGAYVVQDNLTNLIFPGNQASSTTSIAMKSIAAVLRYKRDIGNRYTFGLMATDREGTDYFNRLLGFDSVLRLTNKDRITIQLLGSSTRYPDNVALSFAQPGGRFNDRVIDISYVHSARSVSWWGGYRDIGRNFRADLGFIPQVDYRFLNAGIRHNWIAKPGKWWSNVNINGGYNRWEDQGGNLLREQFNIFMNFNGTLQSFFNPVYSKIREVFRGREFDIDTVSLSGGFRPAGNIFLWFGTTFGDQIDYANIRSGKNIRFLSQMNFDIGRHFRLNLNHVSERMSVEAGKLYTAFIGQGTAIYQLNTRCFLRAIFQYTDYHYNSELYTSAIDPVYNRFFTQLLFSYKINPRTVLFLGYSGDYFGNQDVKLSQKGRTFFLKLSYAWQL